LISYKDYKYKDILKTKYYVFLSTFHVARGTKLT